MNAHANTATVAHHDAKVPFPRTFYIANVIELLERLGFYGMFIGLSPYLTNVVGFNDLATGALRGNFRLLSSLAPVVCGAIADRITFRGSLIIAFVLYAVGYITLFAYPQKGPAIAALACTAIGGGFLKPSSPARRSTITHCNGWCVCSQAIAAVAASVLTRPALAFTAISARILAAWSICRGPTP